MSISKSVVILGCGGHALVVLNVLQSLGKKVLGYVSPDSDLSLLDNNISHLGDDKKFVSQTASNEVLLVNGLGSTSVEQNVKRKNIFNDYREKGYEFLSIVHPSVILADNVVLQAGVQLMAGVVVQPGVEIGANTIINTGSQIDHHSSIGQHVHIAPSVTLCGDVTVSDGCFIGVGAVVIQGIRIGQNSMVYAGSVIRKKSKSMH